MAEVTNSDIFERLGAIGAEMANAKESRRVIHDKLDEAVRAQALISTKLDGTTRVAMQARDQSEAALQNIHRFEREFREVQLPIIVAGEAFKIEAQPILRGLKTVQWIAVTFLGLGVLTAGSVLAGAMYARDQLASIVRWILGF